MLARIDTTSARPSRRPYGPRSACSPSITPMTTISSTGVHFGDIRKARSGTSTIRISPPQTSLPSDADTEQDPLFDLICESNHSDSAPRRYHLKLVDIDSISSDEDSPFGSLFSFTASPIDSPTYSTASFLPIQLAPRPHARPLTPSTPVSFFSPFSPTFATNAPPVSNTRTPLARAPTLRTGDRVDRWLTGGLEPPMTPVVFDTKLHEHRAAEETGQSDWRAIVDEFLEDAEFEFELDDPRPAGSRSG
ncbi:uncharacterized protein BXZ73DRAFT_52690 [Epithele typhae]|uniref:uncharacterized protein n=1 Tax=Epithele typhae TaxID=378194 RepID=UPI002007CF8C|nr:uncharacterized protein BXZ73DRAFT_52690 [Epithele typhae]KAH9918902.1 hypothetical protein BXZ73DRAFT_52690 [Epithele typhae]